MPLSTASLKASVQAAPAPWFVTALGTAAALVNAFGHLSPAVSAVVLSLALTAGTVATAFTVRPVAVPVISGAAAVILGDFALLGLPLNTDEIGAASALVSLALGMFLHLAHIQYTNGQTLRALTAPKLVTVPDLPVRIPVPGTAYRAAENPLNL